MVVYQSSRKFHSWFIILDFHEKNEDFFRHLFVFWILIMDTDLYEAFALGDTSVTVEQVTPPVFPSGPLFPSEVNFHSL